MAWAGGPQVTLNYRYDPLGSLTNLWSSTAKGVTNVYQYDLLGRLSTVLASNTLAASYGYDVVGNLQSLRYANGVTNLYQYDSRNRLTNLVWQAGNYPLASYAYTVGPAGNRVALTENGGSRVYNWAYDYLYRLTGETFSGTSFGFSGSPSVTYGFDAVGNRTNRTSAVTGISTQTATYTPNDWLASDKYDANGNTTNSGALGYQYDVMGHLTNVNSGQILITYDGDGNRVKKTVNGTTTYYLVDDRNPSGYAQVLEEYQGTSLTRVYNYGLALINQQLYDANSHLLTSISYFGTDGHGSTRFLTDANANLTDTYTFDAYGLLMPGASGGSTPNNYLYCGQQWDSDLGFYYLRARYYKPDSGRFWTMDSYEGNNEDPLSLHKYLYCQGSPVDNDDPSGLASTVAAQNGVAVHQYIGDDFTEKVPGGVSGPSVVNVLEGIPGFKLPPKFQGVVTALFPDLTATIQQEVYEIKPDNARSIALGEAQLQAYIDLFNLLDPRKGWHRGTSYRPPLTVPINALNYAIAVGSPATPPGLILYHVFSVQKIVQKKVVQAAVADNADLADSIGISTLTTIIAF